MAEGTRQGPGNGDGPDGPTGITVELTIIIMARKVQWDRPTITFTEIVEQWNKLDPERTVLPDLPGINVTWPEGTAGREILYPSDGPLNIVNGIIFKIDPNYLS